MKIISKFSDYYDHVAGWYGNDEAGPVYPRKDTDDRELGRELEASVRDGVTNLIRRGMYWDDRSSQYRLSLLVVIDRAWVVARPYSDNTAFLWKDWVESNPVKKGARGWWWQNEMDDGKQKAFLLKLSKVVGRPVYEVELSRTYDNKLRGFALNIVGRPPILSQIKGFASKYPAQQIYQDIEYGIVNLLNDSPDMAGPTAITNNEKIVSHGFDLKQSFRHRK